LRGWQISLRDKKSVDQKKYFNFRTRIYGHFRIFLSFLKNILKIRVRISGFQTTKGCKRKKSEKIIKAFVY